MSDFATEWGVKSPWGCSAVESREVAEGVARNMREGGHAASIIWRGVTEWHHEINDELAMQPVKQRKES
jgi:hypothetical protein